MRRVIGGTAGHGGAAVAQSGDAGDGRTLPQAHSRVRSLFGVLLIIAGVVATLMMVDGVASLTSATVKVPAAWSLLRGGVQPSTSPRSGAPPSGRRSKRSRAKGALVDDGEVGYGDGSGDDDDDIGHAAPVQTAGRTAASPEVTPVPLRSPGAGTGAGGKQRKRLVFTISTGHSGTMWLVRILRCGSMEHGWS